MNRSNIQSNTTVFAGTISVSSAGNLGGAGTGLSLTLGGAQAGGGSTVGTLLETTGFTWNGSVTTGGAGGTILVSAGQSGTLTGSVTNSAGLTVGGATNTGLLTLPGVISGSGPLTVGGGTLVLSAANTYTGGVTVQSGTLSVGDDTNLGDPSNTLILNGGTLETTATFSSARAVTLGGGAISPDSGTTLTLSGVLSGAGGLTMSGAGTLVLTAANTYTGGVTVQSGTLSVGDDTNLGDPSNTLILNGGTLETTATFSSARAVTLGGGAISPDSGTTLTLSGVLSGAGGLTMSGGGTLILTAANTYTGDTTVSGGGTLTITGAYTQASTGTLAIEMSPSAASNLAVTGSASLAGTLALTFDSGTYVPRTQYPLLTAGGGVTGTFETVTTSGGANLGLLTPSLSYLPGEVDLTLTLAPAAFTQFAATENQQAVASVLEQAFPTATGDLMTVLNGLVLLQTPGQFQQAFTALDGAAYPGVKRASVDAADAVIGQVFGHLQGGATSLGSSVMPEVTAGIGPGGGVGRAAGLTLADPSVPGTGEDPWSSDGPGQRGRGQGWVQAFGGNDTLQGTSNAPGFTAQPYGVLLGYDHPGGSGLRIGYLLGAWHNTVSFSDGSGTTAGTTSALVGVYAGVHTRSPWFAHALVGYTFDSDQVTRPINFSGVSRTATSSYSGHEMLVAIESGYQKRVGTVTVAPTLAFEFVHAAQPAFTETGANALNLSVAGPGTDSLRGFLEVRVQGGTPRSANADRRFTWDVYGGYSHEFSSAAPQVTAAFAGAPGLSFTVAGVTPAANAVVAGAQVRWVVRNRVDAYLRYDVLWSTNQTNQTATAGVQIHF